MRKECTFDDLAAVVERALVAHGTRSGTLGS
jgi:hypothetical protein